jgi:hypothetical protein
MDPAPKNQRIMRSYTTTTHKTEEHDTASLDNQLPTPVRIRHIPEEWNPLPDNCDNP